MSNDVLDQLRQLRVHVSDEVREVQMTAIAAEINTAPAVAFRPRRAPRRSLAAVAAALVVAVPTIAVAAESALPGDTLYSVKVLFEQPRQIVDEEVSARHRVRELLAMIDAGYPTDEINQQVVNARDALESVDASAALWLEFDTAIESEAVPTRGSIETDATVDGAAAEPGNRGEVAVQPTMGNADSRRASSDGASADSPPATHAGETANTTSDHPTVDEPTRSDDSASVADPADDEPTGADPAATSSTTTPERRERQSDR